MSDTNPREHQALTAALAYGRDLSNVFAALDSMNTRQLRRFTVTCEWLAMHERSELNRQRSDT